MTTLPRCVATSIIFIIIIIIVTPSFLFLSLSFLLFPFFCLRTSFTATPPSALPHSLIDFLTFPSLTSPFLIFFTRSALLCTSIGKEEGNSQECIGRHQRADRCSHHIQRFIRASREEIRGRREETVPAHRGQHRLAGQTGQARDTSHAG